MLKLLCFGHYAKNLNNLNLKKKKSTKNFTFENIFSCNILIYYTVSHMSTC